eukprot:380896-Rhodomonas_salina.2
MEKKAERGGWRRGEREGGEREGGEEGLGQPQRVQARLLPRQKVRPHVCAGPRARQPEHHRQYVESAACVCEGGSRPAPLPVLCAPDQHRGHEGRPAVQLRDLVGEHVAVIVVSDHPEASVAPADGLHRRGVREEVLQLAVAAAEQVLREEAVLVLFVEESFQRQPEAVLPLEYRPLCHHVGCRLVLQTPAEENVAQLRNVV